LSDKPEFPGDPPAPDADSDAWQRYAQKAANWASWIAHHPEDRAGVATEPDDMFKEVE
jgi:hypothetical protein